MSGNIEQRGKNTWRLRVSAGYDPVTRQRRVIRRPYTGTRQEAELELARLIVETADGMWAGTNTTVTDLFAAWLPQARLAPETRYDYSLVIDKHIVPGIGHVQLHKLRTHHLDRFYRRLEDSGLGAPRIRRAHTVLRSALKQAVTWEWIARNPATSASPPPVDSEEQEPPTPAEARRLFELADAHSPFMSVAVRLAADLGCRRGELCGLQWADIDLAAGTVRKRRTVGVVGGAAYVRPISKSKRKKFPAIPISTATVDLLRAWRALSAERLLAMGEPDGWVFPAPKLDSFFRPDRLTHLFRPLADTAGLPHVHVHSLRHYVGTHLYDAGVSPITISKRLGHSRTSTTSDIYGHLVDASSRAAADVIDRINRGGE